MTANETAVSGTHARALKPIACIRRSSLHCRKLIDEPLRDIISSSVNGIPDVKHNGFAVFT